jgi:hypothetical protein
MKNSTPFGVPVIWREPSSQNDDCYFCVTKSRDIQSKAQTKYRIQAFHLQQIQCNLGRTTSSYATFQLGGVLPSLKKSYRKDQLIPRFQLRSLGLSRATPDPAKRAKWCRSRLASFQETTSTSRVKTPAVAFVG